jgi:hypothetical protein
MPAALLVASHRCEGTAELSEVFSVERYANNMRLEKKR